MVRLATRRPIALAAAIVLLALAVGTVVAVPVMVSHPGARQIAVPRRQKSTPRSVTHTPHSPGSTFVQLKTPDLTPDSRLAVTGSGFLSGESLGVTIVDVQGNQEAQLGSISAGADGHLGETSWALPSGLAPGDHRLLIVGNASHRTASVAFRLHDVPPTVALDAYSAKPGQDFRVAGQGFLPNEQVKVVLGSLTAVPLGTFTASLGGNVAGRVTVPQIQAGNYTLYLVGSQGGVPASVGFNVQGFRPWVTLDNYAPSPHFRMGFRGRDFAPGEIVRVYLNQQGGAPVAQVTADAQGRFDLNAAWEVPALQGQNVLLFVGAQTRAVIATNFTVVSSTGPSPIGPYAG